MSAAQLSGVPRGDQSVESTDFGPPGAMASSRSASSSSRSLAASASELQGGGGSTSGCTDKGTCHRRPSLKQLVVNRFTKLNAGGSHSKKAAGRQVTALSSSAGGQDKCDEAWSRASALEHESAGRGGPPTVGTAPSPRLALPKKAACTSELAVAASSGNQTTDTTAARADKKGKAPKDKTSEALSKGKAKPKSEKSRGHSTTKLHAQKGGTGLAVVDFDDPTNASQFDRTSHCTPGASAAGPGALRDGKQAHHASREAVLRWVNGCLASSVASSAVPAGSSVASSGAPGAAGADGNIFRSSVAASPSLAPVPASAPAAEGPAVPPPLVVSEVKQLGRPRGGEPVWLHVYDVSGNTVHWVNSVVRPVGTGAFHAAVEVFGHEWSFGYTISGTGVYSCRPRSNNQHKYRESVCMGGTYLQEKKVTELVDQLRKDWLGKDYDLLVRNCCHFSDALCRKLGVGPAPEWVTHLSGAGAMFVGGVDSAVASAQAAAGLAAAKAGELDEHYQITGKVEAFLRREVEVDEGYIQTKAWDLWSRAVEHLAPVGALAERVIDEAMKPILVDRLDHAGVKSAGLCCAGSSRTRSEPPWSPIDRLSRSSAKEMPQIPRRPSSPLSFHAVWSPLGGSSPIDSQYFETSSPLQRWRFRCVSESASPRSSEPETPCPLDQQSPPSPTAGRSGACSGAEEEDFMLPETPTTAPGGVPATAPAEEVPAGPAGPTPASAVPEAEAGVRSPASADSGHGACAAATCSVPAACAETAEVPAGWTAQAVAGSLLRSEGRDRLEAI